MKNLFKKPNGKIKGIMENIRQKANNLMVKMAIFKMNATQALCNQRGENYVDSGVKILIAVVLGALLLGGLYALFDTVVMPELSKRIKDMFDYKG